MRISRDEMFLRVAEIVALRGTCPRAQVGAVIVRNNRIISIGYNGSPAGTPHCEDVGCDVPYAPAGCVRAIHAELNSIVWAAHEGVPTDRAVMYSTHSPCVNCAVSMVAAGIRAVYYLHEYRLREGLKILDDMGVYYERIDIGGDRRVTSPEGLEGVSGGTDHRGDYD